MLAGFARAAGEGDAFASSGYHLDQSLHLLSKRCASKNHLDK
jgi:hypothetical protein